MFVINIAIILRGASGALRVLPLEGVAENEGRSPLGGGDDIRLKRGGDFPLFFTRIGIWLTFDTLRVSFAGLGSGLVNSPVSLALRKSY